MIRKITNYTSCLKSLKTLFMVAMTMAALPGYSQITIGTGTSATLGTGVGTTSLQSPYNSYYGYTWAQTLYLRNEINAASGNITSISYYFSGTSLASSNGLKIYMANVNRSSFSSTTDWEPISGMTLVFDGTIAGTVPGWINIPLTTPFPYQSAANLVIGVDENTAGDNGTAGYRASNLGTNRVLFYRNDNTNPDPSAPPTADGLSSYVGNIQIYGLTAFSCQPPTAITVPTATITASTAPFSFTAPATSTPVNYQWEVRTSGNPGTAGAISSGNITAPTLTGTATGLSATTSYTLYVRSDCGSGQFSAWNASSSFTTPPANDEASGAIPLTVNVDSNCVVTTAGTTVAATQSSDVAPTCNATGINDDVWYSFTASTYGNSFKFSGSSSTLAVALYTGTPGSLVSVGATGCGSGAAGASINFPGLTPGALYYARVFTTTATAATRTAFSICTGALPIPPSNDECIGAIAFPTIPTDQTCASITVNTYGATQSLAGCAGNADDDVWYSFVCPAGNTSLLFANTSISGATDRTIQFFSGSCGALTSILCSDPESGSVTGLTPGSTYYFRIHDYGASATPLQVSVCLKTPPPPPVNDNCAGAIAFPTILPDGNCVSVVANTTGGTQSLAACAGTADDDVWYSFVCPAGVTKMYFANTDISGSTDRVTQFFSGTCGNLTSILCSDDENNTLTGLTPGSTYYFRIYTYGSANATQVSVCLKTDPPMTYTSSTTTQPTTTTVVQGTTSQNIILVNVVATGVLNPLTLTQLDFNTTGSTNAADIINAKVYYTGTSSTFSTTTPFGNVIANPNGSFSIIGSQALGGGTSATNNYFFLAYDVACNATVGNLLDAQCTGINIGTPQTPTATAPTGSRAVAAVSYTATTVQPSTATTPTGSTDQQILRVAMAGCASSPVTALTFSTTGTTNAADITNARVYFTPTTTFNTTIQFGSAVANPNGTFTVNGTQILGASTGYFWLVYDISPTATVSNVIDASCISGVINGVTATPATLNPTGTRSIIQALVNDEASGATTLTLGAVCSGFPYTNAGSTQSVNEKFPNIRGTAGFYTTWFKFIAPASGMVKITNDYAGGTAGTDTKIGLFSATNPADYATFTALAGDDDNGVNVAARSTMFATGLTSGATYYIAYDGYSATVVQGTFCITVEEMNSSMLATTGTCTAGDGAYSDNSFAGWRSLITSTGLLIANVKQNPGTSGSSVTASININSGAIRRDGNNIPYLDRNYSFTGATATPADVQLFFGTGDFAVLNGNIQADGGSAITLSSLNVTHQTGSTCVGNFAQGAGTNTVLTQTGNGSVNGLNYIQITTPSFSNFYVMAGNVPLPLKLISFKGQNKGAVNTLNWETAEEKNFSHFELQRSANGADFSKLDIVKGNNIATGSAYNYTDNRPFEGSNFYRLLMIDRDGRSTTSNIVELTTKVGSGIAVTVHPNPVSNLMHIDIAGKVDSKATIVILDIVGKAVKTIQPTTNNIAVDMSNMPAGTYIVKYLDHSNTIVTKITKN